MRHLILIALVLSACQPTEPLDLPEDPAMTGTPVGVTTVDLGGTLAEVWYPATDETLGQPSEVMDVMQFVPAPVQDLLPDLQIAAPDTGAVRDAKLRKSDVLYPVVLFSHGFGGMRLQSVDITTHLASRGYVVISADHPGRALPDQLPCLFKPALPGCNLGLGGPDPAGPHVEAAIAWAEAANEKGGLFDGALDLEAWALMGHSAGGGTTSTVGEADSRFDALIPMAGAGAVTRDVPVLVQAGTCDAIVPLDRLEAAAAGTTNARLLQIQGAGHMAFSDLCELGLDEIAATWLAPREDTNQVLLDQLLRLATDGCPGIIPENPPDPACADGYLDYEVQANGIRHYTTLFLDQHLLGANVELAGGAYPGFVIE